MSARRRVIDWGFKALNLFHRCVLRASGGRVGRAAFGLTMVELHTIGRRTNRERRVILGSPLLDESRVILVASKGGDDRHPDWFLNLSANPDVLLVVGGHRRPMRARRASDDEATELWPAVIAVYTPYASYRRRANREIPIVICEPR